jgi:hypothetical protein
MPHQILDVAESKAAISRFHCDDLSASESIIASWKILQQYKGNWGNQGWWYRLIGILG